MKHTTLLGTFMICGILAIAQQRSLTFNDVSVIEIAPNGNVWMGSMSQGCSAFIAGAQTWSNFSTANSIMQSDTVTCIKLFSIGGVSHSFMGSTNGIGYKHGAAWDSITHLPNSHVTAMSQSPDHIFYVATRNGISAYNDTTLAHLADYTTANSNLPSSNISCFQSKALSCNGFYAGTTDSGYFYSPDAVSYTHYSASNSQLIFNWVNCLYVDNNCAGKVYVGTKGGLSICTGANCDNYSITTGLPDNDITAIEKSPDGRTWIGSRNSGVMIFNDTAFQFITTADGLPSNRITDIKCKPDCTCWIGTADAGAVIVNCNGQVSAIPTSIQSIQRKSCNISIFPNPATNILTIKADLFLNGAQLSMYDRMGQLTQTGTVNGTQTQVDISQRSPGIYFYRITQGGQSISSGKLLVQ